MSLEIANLLFADPRTPRKCSSSASAPHTRPYWNFLVKLVSHLPFLDDCLCLTHVLEACTQSDSVFKLFIAFVADCGISSIKRATDDHIGTWYHQVCPYYHSISR